MNSNSVVVLIFEYVLSGLLGEMNSNSVVVLIFEYVLSGLLGE